MTNNEEDIELEIAIQRTRHMRDTLTASAKAFKNISIANLSPIQILDLFGKIAALHSNLAEDARQRLVILEGVEKWKAETAKRMAEMKSMIDEFQKEFKA